MNLSTVRAYRVQLEDALRIELAGLTQRLEEMTQRCVRLTAQRDSIVQSYLRRVQGALSIGELREWYGELEAASIELRQAEEARDAVQQQWSRKQQELIEAVQERKKLDIVEQRRLREARQRAERDAQRLQDETAGRGHQAGRARR